MPFARNNKKLSIYSYIHPSGKPSLTTTTTLPGGWNTCSLCHNIALLLRDTWNDYNTTTDRGSPAARP